MKNNKACLLLLLLPVIISYSFQNIKNKNKIQQSNFVSCKIDGFDYMFKNPEEAVAKLAPGQTEYGFSEYTNYDESGQYGLIFTFICRVPLKTGMTYSVKTETIPADSIIAFTITVAAMKNNIYTVTTSAFGSANIKFTRIDAGRLEGTFDATCLSQDRNTTITVTGGKFSFPVRKQ